MRRHYMGTALFEQARPYFTPSQRKKVILTRLQTRLPCAHKTGLLTQKRGR